MKRLPFVSAYYSDLKGTKFLVENAIVDTGATISAIPESFVQALNLQKIGTVAITSVNTTTAASLYRCLITLKGRKIDATVVALEQIGNAIIGMDIVDEKLITEILVPEIVTESVTILQKSKR